MRQTPRNQTGLLVMSHVVPPARNSRTNPLLLYGRDDGRLEHRLQERCVDFNVNFQ